jgi:glucose-6-phosphate 1-epimerase
LSTVVWNPWIEKSKRMPDFGDDEWPHMVCVESGNVKGNAITLKPGAQRVLKVEISNEPLG